MPDYLLDGLFKNVQHFIYFGVIWWAYSLAKEGAFLTPKPRAVLRALLWCGGIAFFVAASVGRESCLESDPMGGGCLEYDDDGYEVSMEERVSQFISFFTLIFIPSVVGCLKAKGPID